MQLGRSFLLFISLVLAYCAADIQVCHSFCLDRILPSLVGQVQQIDNNLEELIDIETGGIEVKDDLEVCLVKVCNNTTDHFNLKINKTNK